MPSAGNSRRSISSAKSRFIAFAVIQPSVPMPTFEYTRCVPGTDTGRHASK